MANFQDRELADRWFRVIVETIAVQRIIDPDFASPSPFTPVLQLADYEPEDLAHIIQTLRQAAEDLRGSVRGAGGATRRLMEHWGAITGDIEARGLTNADLNAALGTSSETGGVDRGKLASRYVARLFNTYDMSGLRSFAEVDAPTDAPPSLSGARMRVLGAIAASVTDEPFEHLITPDAGDAEWAKMLRQAVHQIGETGTDSGFTDTALWNAKGAPGPLDRVMAAAYDQFAGDEVVRDLAARLFRFSTRVSAVVSDAYKERDIAGAPTLAHQVAQMMTDGDPLTLRNVMTDAIERFDLEHQREPRSGSYVIDHQLATSLWILLQEIDEEGVGKGLVRSVFGRPTSDDIPGMLVASAVESGDDDVLGRLINETLTDDRPDIETAPLRVAAAVAALYLDRQDDAAALLEGRNRDPQARETVASLVRDGTGAGNERDATRVLDLWTIARNNGIADSVRAATPGVDGDDPGLTVESVEPPEPGAPTVAQSAQDARTARYLGLTGVVDSDDVESPAVDDGTPRDVVTGRYAPDPVEEVSAAELAETQGLAAPELNAI